MRLRGLLVTGASLVIAASLATLAIAEGTLVITPSRMTVSYPSTARLVITAPAAVAETITVEACPVGGTFASVAAVPATQAALGTTFTVSPKLRVTSGVRATQGALVSEVVTVSVRAKLVATSVTRHRGRYTFKGTILPNHAVGTAIGVHVWKRTGRGSSAVLTPMPDVSGTVYRSNRQVSWWKATFTPDGKGTYVLQAFHADDGHLLSESRKVTFKVKR